jgi:hypothetical protein
MTGSEFATYVKRKFKRTDKDTELYDAATDTILLMQVKFAPEDFKEEAYVSGISSVGEYQIGLPDDFGHIIGTASIIDTADDEYYCPLKKISKQKYDELYSDRLYTDTNKMHTAVPQHFCIYAGQIYLGPVPDKTTYQIQINYSTETTSEVTSSTDPVPFTSELRHRNVLRNGVLFELHDGLENFEEAAYYKQLFLDGLNDIIKQERANIAPINDNVIYSGF